MSIQAKAPAGERVQSQDQLRGSSVKYDSTPDTGRVKLALELARLGYAVHPLHTVTNGQCSCGDPECRTPGKHPAGHINPDGSRAATTDPATIAQWWALFPDANIGVAVEKSGLLVIDPDNDVRHQDFRKRGLPQTMVVQTGSGNWHYWYRLPAGAPQTRMGKSGDYDLISNGNVVAPGSAGRKPYTLITQLIAVGELPEAPAWAVAMLRNHQKAQDEAAEALPTFDPSEPPVRLSGHSLAFWKGEIRARDRSGHLHGIAKDLWKAGASRAAIVAALAERDQALFDEPKYAGRKDAAKRYEVTANKAILEVMAETNQDTPETPAGGNIDTTPGLVAELEAKVERLQERVRTLRAENERIKEDRRIMLGVLRNKNLKAAEAMTALAVVFDLASGESRQIDEDGWIKGSLDAIAENAGCSKSTASRHIGKLEEWGIVEKEVVRHAPGWIRPDGDIQKEFTSELRLRLNADPRDTLKHLIEIEPPRRDAGHGGKREKRCPECQSDQIQIIEACADCGTVIDRYMKPTSTPESTVARCNDTQDGPVSGRSPITTQDATEPPFHDETTCSISQQFCRDCHSLLPNADARARGICDECATVARRTALSSMVATG